MKILANKDIRDLFLALTLVLCALLLLTVGFMWLCLPELFTVAAAAVPARGRRGVAALPWIF